MASGIKRHDPAQYIPEEERRADVDVKAAIKEGIKEWADEQFATFGKWTLRSVAVSAFSYLVIYLVNHGAFK